MVVKMKGLIQLFSLVLLAAVVLFPAGSALAGGPYDLEFRGADVKDVLRLLSDQEGVNILISEGVSGSVTASFRGVTFDEILTDGENAVLLSPTDVPAWVRTIRALQADTELANRLGRRGFADLASSYTWEKRAASIAGAAVARMGGAASHV